MNHSITFNPTKNHILQLENWLRKEEIENNEGFYCNWNIISNSFDKNELVALIRNDYAIGFLVYTINELIVKIDIAEIKPDHRKQGFGRILIEECLDKFKEDGILVAELFCSPLSSEPVWKRLNFINFPIFKYNNSRVELYRPLVSTKTNSTINDYDEVIELWDEEPYRANGIEPFKVWKVDYIGNSNDISEPIIYPAHYDWQICWRKGNNIKIKDKVKYFNLAEIEFGKFIIIRELPRIKQ